MQSFSWIHAAEAEISSSATDRPPPAPFLLQGTRIPCSFSLVSSRSSPSLYPTLGTDGLASSSVVSIANWFSWIENMICLPNPRSVSICVLLQVVGVKLLANTCRLVVWLLVRSSVSSKFLVSVAVLEKLLNANISIFRCGSWSY